MTRLLIADSPLSVHMSIAGMPLLQRPAELQVWIGVEIDGPVDVQAIADSLGRDVLLADELTDAEIAEYRISGWQRLERGV